MLIRITSRQTAISKIINDNMEQWLSPLTCSVPRKQWSPGIRNTLLLYYRNYIEEYHAWMLASRCISPLIRPHYLSFGEHDWSVEAFKAPARHLARAACYVKPFFVSPDKKYIYFSYVTPHAARIGRHVTTIFTCLHPASYGW